MNPLYRILWFNNLFHNFRINLLARYWDISYFSLFFKINLDLGKNSLSILLWTKIKKTVLGAHLKNICYFITTDYRWILLMHKFFQVQVNAKSNFKIDGFITNGFIILKDDLFNKLLFWDPPHLSLHLMLY